MSFDDDIKVSPSKYKKTNQNTCINLIPVVRKGENVKAELTEGYGTKTEKLAWKEP